MNGTMTEHDPQQLILTDDLVTQTDVVALSLWLKMYSFHVLYPGYSHMRGDSEMLANCSCTLIKGPNNIIVDTMTPWDSQKITDALQKNNITPDDISYVVCTHGHSDHIGNNNLFLKATHIVGYSISIRDLYILHPFHSGTDFVIDSHVKVTPTPGHTLSDVTVLLSTDADSTVAIAGDLFENSDDINKPSIWLDAGSESPALQRQNRLRVAEIADWIVPGHGDIFNVTPHIRETLRHQSHEKLN